MKKGAYVAPSCRSVADGRVEEHPVVQTDKGQKHVCAKYVHVRFFRQFHIPENEKHHRFQREHNGQRSQFLTAGESQQGDEPA